MIVPAVGSVCQYTFTTPFSALNGVYQLLKTMTFELAQEESVDFVADLYAPAGRTEADYTAEWAQFASSVVLRVKKMNLEPEAPDVIYHVPAPIIALVPDPMVRRYHDLSIAIDLGVHGNPEKIAWIIAQLNDIAANLTGTLASAVLLSNREHWMTEAEYNAIDAERQARIAAIKPLSVVVRDQQTQINALHTEVDAMRKLMQTVLPALPTEGP